MASAPAYSSSPPDTASIAETLAALNARPRRDHEAHFFYHDTSLRCAAVKVLPGEYFVHDEDIALVTVLGSCISACIWDRERRVGGMNHFMLPEGSSGDDGGRYGAYAMELLINELLKRGARKSTMQAKLVGGGAVVQSFTTMNVGERNTQFAVDFLRTENIAVVSKDVLDTCARKVCFFPASGRAMVKKLASMQGSDVVREESRYRSEIAKPAAVSGSVELF
ncbi:MAG TPA: chemoreceptor glutamine deamidase CheD [Burkholderiaceae bacterium]|nr:chemoreceptor glutamine deamidase CheD [Burkholderiaceae bacterium]